jgi:hypothetical protein
LIDCPEAYKEKPEVRIEASKELVEVPLSSTNKEVTKVGCTLNSK